MNASLRALIAATLLAGSALAETPVLPPSSFALLQPRALTPGFLDAAPSCLRGEQSATLPPPGSLAAAVRTAREAGDPHDARRELAAALGEHPDASGPERACTRLEQARLALRAGLGPEARAEVDRARREMEEARLEGELEDIARFYRAESLVVEGRRAEAHPAYASLRRSPHGAIGVAARLRELDLRAAWPLPDPETAVSFRDALEPLLDEARERAIDDAPWAARRAELAIAAQELDDAHRLLAIAERVEDRAGVASVRKADVLVALGRGKDARRVLERVLDSAASKHARELARARLAAYGLAPEEAAGRIERLRRAARAAHPAVTAQARDALSRLLLDSGDLPGALEALAKEAHDGAPAMAKPRFQENLDRALRGATAEEIECPAVVRFVGGRRALFVRLAAESAPLVRLGDCLLELGMPEPALEVYRGVARRFALGPNRVALRIARTSLDLGELTALRAAVRAREADADALPPSSDEAASWRWLGARIALADGRVRDAVAELEALAAGDALSGMLRAAVERDLRELADAEVDRGRLVDALLRSLARPADEIGRDERGQTWLRAADVLVSLGRESASRAAYLRAAQLLPEGERRQRSIYAAAALQGNQQRVRAALERAGQPDRDSPWTRLGRVEDRIASLRAPFQPGALP